jgi:hypothetical protein
MLTLYNANIIYSARFAKFNVNCIKLDLYGKTNKIMVCRVGIVVFEVENPFSFCLIRKIFYKAQ